MGFEKELHRAKQEFDDKRNNAGLIRVQLLREKAGEVVRLFQAKCLKEAKMGHAFCDIMHGFVPVRAEDVTKVKTLVKRNLLIIIQGDIPIPSADSAKLTTNFILPFEKEYFEKYLRESLAKAGMENAVIRVVSVYKTVDTSKKKGILIKRVQKEQQQVVDHEAFRISMSW